MWKESRTDIKNPWGSIELLGNPLLESARLEMILSINCHLGLTQQRREIKSKLRIPLLIDCRADGDDWC